MIGRAVKVGFCLEEDGDERANSCQDDIHPEHPSPVRSSILNLTCEDATKSASTCNHEGIETNFGSSFMKEVDICYNSWA